MSVCAFSDSITSSIMLTNGDEDFDLVTHNMNSFLHCGKKGKDIIGIGVLNVTETLAGKI